MKRLKGGIWPVMLTPFTPTGEIDFRGLENLTEYYISVGASGLFANCLSSEMYHLSVEERLSVVEAVVRYSNDRVDVIASGTFSERDDINVPFSRNLIDLGVKAVIVNSNQLCGESEDDSEFKKRLERFMDKTGEIPLGIYECPVPYKRLLTAEILSWMSGSGRFFYFKDTSCDSGAISKKLEAIIGSNLQLYNANTPTALQSLKDGAAGLSPIGANYYPELFIYLYNKQHSPNSEGFQRTTRFLVEHDAAIHRYYPYSAKWFLGKRGLGIGTYTRTEYERPSKEGMKQLEHLFQSFAQVASDMGINMNIK